MKFKDYYSTLGVTRQASQDELKRAYRRLARKYHPDVSKEADAEKRFKEIQEAYEVLKDTEKRATYDRMGSGFKADQEFRPPPDWDVGFNFKAGPNDVGGFSDFFESIFGRVRSEYRGESSGRTASTAKNDQNQHAKVHIDLEDAYKGAVKTVSLTASGLKSGGNGISDNRTLNVKIPQGITAGQRIRLAGQGSIKTGRERGDLYLEILFNPHRLFKSEQRDIHLDLPITPWEAALGRTITVPTLGGRVELRIPAGSQSGSKLRLKGRGLPGDPPGDQIVTLRIVTPSANTSQAKIFYERMESELPMNPRADI